MQPAPSTEHLPPDSWLSEGDVHPKSPPSKSAQPLPSLSRPSLHWGIGQSWLQFVLPLWNVNPVPLHLDSGVIEPPSSEQQHPSAHAVIVWSEHALPGKKKLVAHSFAFNGASGFCCDL